MNHEAMSVFRGETRTSGLWSRGGVGYKVDDWFPFDTGGRSCRGTGTARGAPPVRPRPTGSWIGVRTSDTVLARPLVLRQDHCLLPVCTSPVTDDCRGHSLPLTSLPLLVGYGGAGDRFSGVRVPTLFEWSSVVSFQCTTDHVWSPAFGCPVTGRPGVGQV